MLICLVPKDQCTIGDLLDQVQISKSLDANVSVYCKPCSTIDYMIAVGVNLNDIPRELFVAAEHTMKGDRQQKVQVLVTSNVPPRPANSQQVILTQTRDGTVVVIENINFQSYWLRNLMNLLESSHELFQARSTTPGVVRKEPQVDPKYVDGLYAVCTFCGYSGINHAQCQR